MSRAARFWDEHHGKVRDPGFWMADPLCRAAINRRVSGSGHEWPLDWFRRVRGRTPFARGVSWGCGLGAFERAAVQIGLVNRVDAFDLSTASLRGARRLAREEAVSGIRYRSGDFDRPRLPASRYDIVFFHQSLHHVSRLEALFEALDRALLPGAIAYVDEYVGPSRAHWSEARLRTAQEILDGLPADAKRRTVLIPPIESDDPSEAIRSDEIVPLLRERFEILEWRPYGGQLADLLFPYLDPDWRKSPAGREWVAALLLREEEQLAADPDATHYLVACGRVREKASPSAPAGSALRRLFAPLRSTLRRSS